MKNFDILKKIKKILARMNIQWIVQVDNFPFLSNIIFVYIQKKYLRMK